MKIIRSGLLLVIALGLLVCTTGCATTPETDSDISVQSFAETQLLLPQQIDLFEVSDRYKIEPVWKGIEQPEYQYLSDNPVVATVDEDGWITAEGMGLAYVSVTARSKDGVQTAYGEILIVCGDIYVQSGAGLIE